MRRLHSTRSARFSAGVPLLVASIFLFQSAAFPRSTAEKLDQASHYYDDAVNALLELQLTPPAQLHASDYEKVIRAFRRVYQTAPTSPHNAKSFMSIGDTYQAMARSLKSDKYFSSALQAYDFLMQEYPHSKYNVDAILASARIYQSDLKQPEEARKRFELFLQKYPRYPRVDEVELAIANIQSAKASPKAEGVKAEAPKTEALKVEAPKNEAAKNEAPQPSAQPSVLETLLGPSANPSPNSSENQSAPETSEDRVPITDIRQWITPAFTRVVIDLGGEVKYKMGTLNKPPRIYVDLYGTEINRAVARKAIALDNGPLKHVRAAEHKAGVTRVVLEMDNVTDYSVFDLPNPYRLIVDLHIPAKVEPPPAEQISARTGRPDTPIGPPSASLVSGNPLAKVKAVKTAAIEPAAIEKVSLEPASDKNQPTVQKHKNSSSEAVTVEKPNANAIIASVQPVGAIHGSAATEAASDDNTIPDAVSERLQPVRPNRTLASREPADDDPDPVYDKVQTAQPNRNGNRSLTRALGLKIGRIIIDPGHGGHDTGTIGPSGLYEKDLVLDVSLRLGKLISERLGSEVVYTRQDDTFVPLETRTAIANQKMADLFLSIHANSSQSESARGVETYYLSFATNPEALEVAARENAGSQESIHELQDLVKKIALNEKVDESKEFAADVQSALRDQLNKGSRQKKDRGVKKAPFMVLVGARMPSVLAEISFLSNPQEEKILRTKVQRQKIAEALYAGIKKYADTLSGVKVARTENIAAAAPK